MMQKLEFEGFAVRQDKRALAKEWLAYLRAHQQAVEATLAPEGLAQESIWSLEWQGRLYLCWYSMQTQPAKRRVTASPDSVDQRHVAYWAACIDPTVPVLKFKLENAFNRPG